MISAAGQLLTVDETMREVPAAKVVVLQGQACFAAGHDTCVDKTRNSVPAAIFTVSHPRRANS